MIKENSRKLVVDGQVMLDEATQINASYSDNMFDNITIQLVKGPEWNPTSAALLLMSGNARQTSQLQKNRVKLGASPTSPSKAGQAVQLAETDRFARCWTTRPASTC